MTSTPRHSRQIQHALSMIAVAISLGFLVPSQAAAIQVEAVATISHTSSATIIDIRSEHTTNLKDWDVGEGLLKLGVRGKQFLGSTNTKDSGIVYSQTTVKDGPGYVTEFLNNTGGCDIGGTHTARTDSGVKRLAGFEVLDVDPTGLDSAHCEDPSDLPDGPIDDDGGSGSGGGGCHDCAVCGCSPIVVDLDRGGFRFGSLDDGVRFDIDADGDDELLGWTSSGSGDAFLALDRDEDGRIHTGHELFGNFTPQPTADVEPNGFLALAIFDQPSHGGNGDGHIDSSDAVFDRLVLWLDADRDGWATPAELASLEEHEVNSIDLDYVSSRRLDRHGNMLRYKAIAKTARGDTLQVVDVFFVAEDD